MDTEYLLGRVLTLIMSAGMIAGCVWLLHRKRASWRVIVPVILWALSIAGRAVVPVFSDPPAALLTTWARLNTLYSGILITAFMALLYVCVGGKHDV